MTLLPVVERELRVAARKPATYWLRFGAAAVLLALFIMMQSSARPGQTGLELLRWMTMGLLGYALFAGLFLTADSISQEKRDGTLGLLFLTPLRAVDVVSGKFAACSGAAMCAMAACVPTIAFPLLLGGVTVAEIGRLASVLGLALLYSLAQGIFVSVVARDSRTAMGGTLLLGITLSGLFPALWWLQHATVNLQQVDWLLWTSPVFAYGKAFDSGFRAASGVVDFRNSMLTIGGLTVGFMAAASYLLARTWREQEGTRSPQAVMRRKFSFQGEILEQNPFHWLVSRNVEVSRFVKVASGILLFIFVSSLLASLLGTRPIPLFVTCLLVAYGLHLLVKVAVAVEATRNFSDDHRSGALELLLVTPLRVEQILNGQTEGLWQKFRRIFLMLLLLNLVLVFVVVTFGEQLKMSASDRTIFTAMFIGGALAVVIDSGALAWVGMSSALRTPKHLKAVFATIMKLLLPPWVGIFLISAIGSNSSIRSEAVFWIVVWWHGFGAVVALGLRRASKRKLTSNFRELVANGG